MSHNIYCSQCVICKKKCSVFRALITFNDSVVGIIDSVFFFILLALLEYNVLTRCNAPKSIDPDDGPRPKY